MGRTRAGVKRERGAEGAEDSAGHELQASTPDTVKKRRTAQAAGAVKVKIEPPAEESDLGKARVKLEVKQEPTEETEQECAAPVGSTSRGGSDAKAEVGASELKSEDEMKVQRGLDLSGGVPRESPVFPGWNHPSVEECYALDRELAALHGKKPIPAHSGMTIMDSLVATILSQATTGTLTLNPKQNPLNPKPKPKP
eukprot:Tamp_27384.p1 GENE.Tamp_27384~~Tamp_27384.p1  ORF type:complete len:215 (+),score=25.54 Tamp_27384:56-646(+)